MINNFLRSNLDYDTQKYMKKLFIFKQENSVYVKILMLSFICYYVLLF